MNIPVFHLSWKRVTHGLPKSETLNQQSQSAFSPKNESTEYEFERKWGDSSLDQNMPLCVEIYIDRDIVEKLLQDCI